MNIVKSLIDLLCDPQARFSSRHKNERFTLEMAIVVTIFAPLFAYISTISYQGDIPPVVPLIKTEGVFLTKECSARKTDADFCGFRSGEGKIFPIEYLKQYSLIRNYARRHDGVTRIRVEGFYLLNGRGNFWITKATTLSGEELLSETDSYSNLENMRSMILLLSSLYMIAVVLWCMSIRSAIRFGMRIF